MSALEELITAENLSYISRCFGDTFYLLDTETFRKNYKDLSGAFRSYYPEFNIAYSYKTNYIPELARIVNSLGGYAEVVSDMEMTIALRSGVLSSRIIWNGPVKNPPAVSELLLSGGTVNLDSSYELDNIKDIIKKHQGHVLNLGVRCNFDVGDGVLSRFGIDTESSEFDEVMRFIAGTPEVHLKILHCHFAKRLPDFWEARTLGMLRVYDTVASEYGLMPDILDLGGGIYGRMPDSLREQLGIREFTYQDYAAMSARLFSEHFHDTQHKPYLFIEPGSALAGDCMKFVCRVKSIKDIRGKLIAALSGSQQNISMNGLNPPIEIIPCGNTRRHYRDIDLAGYTCIESDVLYRNYDGPLSVGDYVVVSNCGSYSLVMKPPFILPNCPVLDICNGNIENLRTVKRAEVFDDLFCTFTF